MPRLSKKRNQKRTGGKHRTPTKRRGTKSRRGRRPRTPTPPSEHSTPDRTPSRSRTPTPQSEHSTHSRHSRTHPRYRIPTDVGLTPDEIEGVLLHAGVIQKKHDKTGPNDTEEEVSAFRESLARLRFDPEYRSCFNQQRLDTFFQQALEKLQCFINNDNPLV